MAYTQQVERSRRFRLALRMGLPIFLLTLITFFAMFNQHKEGLFVSFITASSLLLGVMVYFIFYLIYQSSRENIIDTTTHTFTPDYFFSLYAKEKGVKTLLMISLENIWAINERYGIKNGDAILKESVDKINTFFSDKGFEKLIITRYKGGDFLLFFSGKKENYIPLLELFIAKYQDHLVNDIEVRLESSLVDSRLSDDYDMLISRLYELHFDRKSNEKSEIYSINELENQILDALEGERFSIGLWHLSGPNEKMYDTSIKLIDSKGGLIHQSRYVPVLNRLNKMRNLEMSLLEKIGKLCGSHEGNFILTITSVTLRNPYFFEHAVTMFERFPKARGRITLMFEEKEYCHQLDRFKQQLGHYRKVGYKIALDRLGGYHTTMLYLKELEIDLVRFDSIYARHLKEQGYQNILQGLNLSAHLCGAQTWLPLIEDEHTELLAKSLKINYRQGNYLGKILTLDEIAHKETNNEIR